MNISRPQSRQTIIAIVGTILVTAAVFTVTIIERRHRPQIQTAQVHQKSVTDLYAGVTQQDTAPLPIAQNNKGRYLKVPILMYHHVGSVPEKADAVRRGLTVSPEEFEQQVKWIKDQGYESISLEDLYNFSQKNGELPKKPVIFTFDDGYSDVFENAIPILKKHGYTGSFAIITRWPGDTQGTNQYATWQQIAAAHDEGMEIVSHTQDHFDAKDPKYKPDFIQNNLYGSYQDIQEHLGTTTNILIYPYGHYNTQYIQLARKAGFSMGITVHEGNRVNLDNMMEVPRIRVNHNQNMKVLEEEITR